MMVTLRAIFCRFQIEGVHQLPTAVDEHQRHVHRHLFHFLVTLNAFVGPRDSADQELLNPVRLRQMCVEQFGGLTCPTDFGEKSVIEIAEWMAEALYISFHGRGVRVEVSEDGENGAVVTYGADDTTE